MASRASLGLPSSFTCPSRAAWMLFGNGGVQPVVSTFPSLCCWRAGPGQSGHHDPSYRSRERWCLWPTQNITVWSGISPKSQDGADDVGPAPSREGSCGAGMELWPQTHWRCGPWFKVSLWSWRVAPPRAGSGCDPAMHQVRKHELPPH